MLGQSMAKTELRLQKQAESAMRTPVTVSRSDGSSIDIFTGLPVAGQIWAGRVKIKNATEAQQSLLGEQVTTETYTYIHLPISSAPELQKGDLIEATEGVFAGTKWAVVETHKASYRTAQRVRVQEAEVDNG